MSYSADQCTVQYVLQDGFEMLVPDGVLVKDLCDVEAAISISNHVRNHFDLLSTCAWMSSAFD